MQIQAAIDIIARFSLLAMPQTPQLLHLCKKTKRRFESDLKSYPKADPEILLIKCLLYQYEQTNSENGLDWSKTELIFAEGTDVQGWNKFREKSSQENFLSLVLCEILGFTPEKVSESFGCSPASIQYRLAQSFEQLGELGATPPPRSSTMGL